MSKANKTDIIRMMALALHGLALANAASEFTARQTIVYDSDGKYDSMTNGGTYGGFHTAYQNALFALCGGYEDAYTEAYQRTDAEFFDVLLPLAREGNLEATRDALRRVFAPELYELCDEQSQEKVERGHY